MYGFFIVVLLSQYSSLQLQYVEVLRPNLHLFLVSTKNLASKFSHKCLYVQLQQSVSMVAKQCTFSLRLVHNNIMMQHVLCREENGPVYTGIDFNSVFASAVFMRCIVL